MPCTVQGVVPRRDTKAFVSLAAGSVRMAGGVRWGADRVIAKRELLSVSTRFKAACVQRLMRRVVGYKARHAPLSFKSGWECVVDGLKMDFWLSRGGMRPRGMGIGAIWRFTIHQLLRYRRPSSYPS